MITKAKTIKMLLYDGSLNGVTNLSDSAWEIGKMYSAPRESISDLVSRADCKRYGVYLLLSQQQVYVGQAIDLERRTKQHLADKDWWTQVVLMTTKDDSFNASDIDYLESRLIGLAGTAATFDSDNKKKGNPQKVDEFRQAELEQYLMEALFLLELIGVRVFKQEKKKISKNNNSSITVLPNTNATFPALEKSKSIKPQLPDQTLLPGEFVKNAISNLIKSGYIFSDQQIKAFGSVEGSKFVTRRNLPLFWVLNEGESRKTLAQNIKERYWKEEYTCGTYRFLVYSQWYSDPKRGATKENFIEWYQSL